MAYLVAAPAGTITCSVQGDKPQWRIQQYHIKACTATGNRLRKGLLRASSPVIWTPPIWRLLKLPSGDVGVYLEDRENVIDVIRRLAGSVGAQTVITRAGKLALLQVDLSSFRHADGDNGCTIW